MLQGYPGADIDEGQGMCELIYDLAPGARLAYCGAFGEGDMADQIRRLADPAEGNCRIITDDNLYPEEPVYQRGVIGHAIVDVRAQGVAYFTAANNYADRSCLSSAPAFVAQAGGAAQLQRHRHGRGGAAAARSGAVGHVLLDPTVVE